MRRPLDLVLGAPSHIAILRALLDIREGLSGREIARRAGINHQTCAATLVKLENRGVVRRIGSGRSQLFRLNRQNDLVRTILEPMFEEERKKFLAMQAHFAEVVKGICVSGVLFGSVSRGEETAASDYDIALIVEKKNRKVHSIVQDLVARGMQGWGVRVSPIILTRTEFIKRIRGNDPLASAILSEGITFYGKLPRGLLS